MIEEYVEPERPMADNSRFLHVTVLLSKNLSPVKKNLRCIYCGLVVGQHHRLIEMIYEGRVVEERRGIEEQCRRCKTIYVLI